MQTAPTFWRSLLFCQLRLLQSLRRILDIAASSYAERTRPSPALSVFSGEGSTCYEPARIRYYSDPQRDLERWLLRTGQLFLDSTIFGIVETELAK